MTVALARYFDKAILAGSSVLQGFDPAAFTKTLESHVIGIAWDGPAAESQEGRTALALIVELLARLYPVLAFAQDDGETSAFAASLIARARAINERLDLAEPAAAMVWVCVGQGAAPANDALALHVGSDGWIARFSSRGPVPVGSSPNPFGAAAAACLGAANVFRYVFGDQLVAGDLDGDVQISVLTLDPLEAEPTNPTLPPVDFGEAFLVGAGAIGSATVWTLTRVPALAGTLHVVDGEKLDLSNVQRYVGSSEAEIGTVKVELAARALANTGLRVEPAAMRWGEFLKRRGDWGLESVLVALDSAEDRILVQGALPRWIANAWTQPGDIGVSRHDFDDERACLACLYTPKAVQPHLRDKVAEDLKLTTVEAKARVSNLLYNGDAVGEEFLREVATAMNMDVQPLLPFADKPLIEFYHVAVCGGLILSLGGGSDASRAEVPLAFQSAMAGVLLAAELVAHAGGLRSVPLAVTTKINLLRPLGSVLCLPHGKAPGCICGDEDYLAAYRTKYEHVHGSGDASLRATREGPALL
ncbi:E2 ligase fold family C protein [Longimicrobium sp.]|uniref:E2 ligase fold family C protein n=1 Tax=Longimicrobium sp. TaxID=2029185 RepID=UPI002D7EC8C4|nr:E2 ligase fold family C protein [Longimicrobium sp.]